MYAGISVFDITPPRGLCLMGYARPPRPNQGAHDPLRGLGLYLRSGDTEAVVVSLDLLYVGQEVCEAVYRGVDFFDCVYPSRNGRHGHAYTHRGKINLNNARFSFDETPIEEGCGCPACRSYTRAYIHHLFKAKEMLGMRLLVLHNLYFYNHLMEEIRSAIEDHRYEKFRADWAETWESGT